MSSVHNIEEFTELADNAPVIGPDRRRWIGAASLLIADLLAFFSADLLFRAKLNSIHIFFFAGSQTTALPIDMYWALAAVFVVGRYVSGDYSQRLLLWDCVRRTTITLLFLSIPSLVMVELSSGQLSLVGEAACWAFLLFAVPTFRQLARAAMASAGVWGISTALIASPARATDTYKALSTRLSLGCNIRWLVLESSEGGCADIPESVTRLPLGGPDQVVRRLLASGCGQVIVAPEEMDSHELATLVQRLTEVGLNVAFIPSFRRLPLVGATTSLFLGKDIVIFQIHRHLQRRPARLLKRSFDICGSLALLTVLSPFFAVIGICIKLHDRGPVFYSQKRVGLNGRQFPCMKFRTMAADADARLDQWKIANPELYQEFLKTYKLPNDPRITTPGRWLRKTSLDELPQLINVLKGEMSLVGPRPIPEQQLTDQYGPAAELYKTVRPGLTGLWQVSGRNDTSLEDRVYFDEWYILNWRFWYDIVILLQTAWVVVTGRGAY